MVGKFADIIDLLQKAAVFYPGRPLRPDGPILVDLIQLLLCHPLLEHRWQQKLCYDGGWRVLDPATMATYLVFDLIRGTFKIEEVSTAFATFASSNELQVRYITAIAGPKFNQIIELEEKVRLVPPELLTSGFGKERFFNTDGFQFQWVMPTAALEIRSVVKFDGLGDNTVQLQNNREFDARLREVENIRQLLILHLNCAVEILGTYTEIIDAHPLFNHFFGASYRSTATKPAIDSSLFSARLQNAYKPQLNVDATIQLAINKLSSSRSRSDAAEAFFDLGSALEILLTKGDTNTGEIAYRLALRAALLLGTAPDERNHWFKLTKDVYAQRSIAAHQGALKQPKNKTDAENRANLRKNAENMVVKLIEILLPGFPIWKELELGISSTVLAKSAPLDVPSWRTDQI